MPLTKTPFLSFLSFTWCARSLTDGPLFNGMDLFSPLPYPSPHPLLFSQNMWEYKCEVWDSKCALMKRCLNIDKSKAHLEMKHARRQGGRGVKTFIKTNSRLENTALHTKSVSLCLQGCQVQLCALGILRVNHFSFLLSLADRLSWTKRPDSLSPPKPSVMLSLHHSVFCFVLTCFL